MRRILKILAILVALVALAAGGLVAYGEMKRTRKVDVAPRAFAPATGSGALAAGQYLYETRGCAECHGKQGEGKVVVDAPDGLYVRGPSLAPGPGSVVAVYKEADWDRAVRHGVRRDGTPLLIMPSEDYNRLTDGDLASLVAYIGSLPPRAAAPGEVRFPLLLRALYATGVIHDAAEKIDHAQPVSQPVPVAVSVEHGAYVVQTCIGCHGPRLQGGKIPNAPPDWPPAANIGAGPQSTIKQYADATQFRSLMRTGKRPDGSAVSKVMPFESFSRMNDTDLDALFTYLKAQAAKG